jgi:vancomycin resistance protein YoaR
MRKIISSSAISIRWMGLFGLLCVWTSCSSPKLAQNSTIHSHAYSAETTEAPQAAQGRTEATIAEDAELVASSDPTILPAVSENLAASVNEIAIENPKLARKVAKLANKVEKQAAVSKNGVQQANVKDQHAAKQLLAKAEKKFDIMKAKKANAAQANTTLVALGALLAIVGLVLVLATSGTASTIGIVALGVGVVLLIISLLTN